MDEEVILNYKFLNQITSTIKKLSHSGSKNIGICQIDEIIKFCSISTKYVDHVFLKLMLNLKKDHSEVRLSVVSIFNHLFNSFDSFRLLFLNNSDDYFKYTLGEKFNQILPPPKNAADELIKLVIKNLNLWYLKYGKDYPKLHKIYYVLKNEKCVDFENLEIYNKKERADKEKAAAESLKINKSLLTKACHQMKDIEDDIRNSLTSLQTCFDLLIDFPDNRVNKESSNSFCQSNDDLRLHGVLKPYQNIEINLDSSKVCEIKINEENRDIIENAREMYSLISKKYLPKVKACSILLSKVGDNEELSCEVALLENNLESIMNKYEKMKFVDVDLVEDCVSTDSELEEVEEQVISKEKPKAEIESELFKEVDKIEKEKPCCSKSLETYSDRKKELLKVAPKVTYSTDLYNWEEKASSTQTLLPTATDGHRFWASSSVESIEVPAESTNMRVIEFSGQFEPVTRACRAPLPSGKLCARHDRVKCPFHGIIVPRNEIGEIINDEDIDKVKKSKVIEIIPEWQDPKLLAELKATTGLDLKIGRKKRKKNPNLSDINKRESTYKKISKKIFKKSSMKRVNNALDNLDYKRHRDKFKDQFNYLH